MRAFLWQLFTLAVTAGAVSATVRYVLMKTIDHLFASQRLKLEAEWKKLLKEHEAAIKVWSVQEIGRFEDFRKSKSEVITRLVTQASNLRRAILAISQVRDSTRIDVLYKEYCDLFYDNPLLPTSVVERAHEFRRAAEEATGACSVAEDDVALSAVVVNRVDQSYQYLRDQAANLLLPTIEDWATAAPRLNESPIASSDSPREKLGTSSPD